MFKFKTFHDLRRRTQNARPGTVAYRAHNLIISAETNANETPGQRL